MSTNSELINDPTSTKSESSMSSKLIQLQPHDEYNQSLEADVHPPQWQNPTPSNPYHFVVIGAGTAGLVTAAGAAGLGARVALIERELMGGDCLNVGCVPSKGVIRAARVAASVRDAEPYGVHVPNGVEVDFGKAMQRMRRLRAKISPNDSAKRFSEMGIDVFFGKGSFVNDNTLSVTREDGSVSELKFKKAVIASGARASAPPIPGLDTVSYLTNENLFSLTELPKRFGIVGSGPIGSEMAQTFARLGSEVFLFERGRHLLPREDSDAATVVQKHFEHDGVNLFLEAVDMKLSPEDDGTIRVQVTQKGEAKEVVVDQLLVAVGRAPNTEGLNLEAVNVTYDSAGVEVNDHLQTTNPRIFAAVGPFGKKKASDLVIPWATYTSPEVAHVGMYEKEAIQAGIEIDTYVQHFSDVDRAILEGQDDGFVKVFTKKGTDKIVGATIVAENAGDMISEITLAMTAGIGLGKIGAAIHPYPTQAEAIRKLGDQFSRTRLTPLSKKILNVLQRLNVGK